MSKDKLTILSIGWGVQSWTLAAMCAKGLIEKPDYILHADTTWEHQHTYEFAEKWTPWLEKNGMMVITCKDEVATKKVLEEGCEQTHLPLFTESISVVTEEDVFEVDEKKTRELENELEERLAGFEGFLYDLEMKPCMKKVGTRFSSKTSKGQLNRSCTHRWKIVPQRRVMTELLKKHGLKKSPGVIQQMIGISMDEWTRMKTSDVKYVELTFPLVDRKISRKDCIEWLMENELDVPKKSSCVFCPYHSLYAWHQLKEEGGQDWETARIMDENIRDKRLAHGFKCYLSDKRVPLKDLHFGEFAEPTLFDLSEYACDSGHCFL